MNKAMIFEIKRFAVHDGDGIRTTVFFKGCSLKCVWCHNPEGIAKTKQLGYYAHKCAGCGRCVEACPEHAHKLSGNVHTFDKQMCKSCGKCEEVCLGDALRIYGKEYTAEELIPFLTEDKDFYDNSDGGVTLSGGECLLYADFCAELLKKLKEQSIHTAVDTCGLVPREAFDKVMPYTDVFLYDIKAIDENTHIECTGKSNKVILENLKYIDECGKKTEIRIPYVPEYNDGEIDVIFDFLKDLKNISKIRVLAYHNYAASKYDALMIDNTLPDTLPDEKTIQNLQKKADLILKR